MNDKWLNRSTYACKTCFFYYPKTDEIGRCRRRAPTMNGFPVVYPEDACGDHKIDHAKLYSKWKRVVVNGVEGYQCPKCTLIYRTLPDHCYTCGCVQGEEIEKEKEDKEEDKV